MHLPKTLHSIHMRCVHRAELTVYLRQPSFLFFFCRRWLFHGQASVWRLCGHWEAAASGPGRLTEEKTATNTPESHYSNLPGCFSIFKRWGRETGRGRSSKEASERAQDLRRARLANWRLQGVEEIRKLPDHANALKMAHSNVHSE